MINFLIEEVIQKNNEKFEKREFEIKYTFGSTFPNDNSEEYREIILSGIRNEMESNNLLVIKNLDCIYSSLFDLFNQDFTKIDNKYYTRISFGIWKPLSNINKHFKIIVVVNEEKVCYEDPPFLNRFEKHIFNLDYLLSKEEKKIASEVNDIIMNITDFKNSKINLNNHLVNFNIEEIEALVYKMSKEKKKRKNIDIINEVLKLIVPTFTEEIIASMFVSGFKEKKKEIAEKIFNIYSQSHPCNFSDFIFNKMNQPKSVIYTYSTISDELEFVNNQKNKNEDIDINEIIEEKNVINDNLFKKETTKEIFIESIKSILDLTKLINDFLSDKNYNLFIIKFNQKKKDICSMNQINYIIDECIENKKKDRNEKKSIDNKYFIFLVYLIRDAKS